MHMRLAAATVTVSTKSVFENRVEVIFDLEGQTKTELNTPLFIMFPVSYLLFLVFRILCTATEWDVTEIQNVDVLTTKNAHQL